MKIALPLIAASCVAFIAAPAFADSINFAQFGPDGTGVSDGSSGVTNGGDTFTIFSPGASPGLPAAGFEELQEGASWAGEFAPGETILFDNYTPGLTTIDFATPVSSIQDLEAQANSDGFYTATLTAYNSLGAVVSSDSYNGDNEDGPEGTIGNLNVFGSGIASITIGTTDDGEGFALGGTGGTGNPPPISAAPEPATWLLMFAGIGGIGLMLRQARRKMGFRFRDAFSA